MLNIQIKLFDCPCHIPGEIQPFFWPQELEQLPPVLLDYLSLFSFTLNSYSCLFLISTHGFSSWSYHFLPVPFHPHLDTIPSSLSKVPLPKIVYPTGCYWRFQGNRKQLSLNVEYHCPFINSFIQLIFIKYLVYTGSVQDNGDAAVNKIFFKICFYRVCILVLGKS